MPTLTSKSCPMCGESLTIDVTDREMRTYLGGALIQQAFPMLSIDQRERFVSGYCGPCWTEIFADVEV